MPTDTKSLSAFLVENHATVAVRLRTNNKRLVGSRRPIDDWLHFDGPDEILREVKDYLLSLGYPDQAAYTTRPDGEITSFGIHEVGDDALFGAIVSEIQSAHQQGANVTFTDYT